MTGSYEYQIYIGCTDSQTRGEVIHEHELRAYVAEFFERRKIDFTLLSCKGGFLYEDGWYSSEDTLCINIIGDAGFDIFKLARALSMFMNQECSLIVRNVLRADLE